MNYIVISNERLDVLSAEVNSAIDKGYVPQGGIAITRSGGYAWYAQALVKTV